MTRSPDSDRPTSSSGTDSSAGLLGKNVHDEFPTSWPSRRRPDVLDLIDATLAVLSSMFSITQSSCSPCVHDRGLDAVEMLPVAQHPTEQNNVGPPSGTMEDNDTEPEDPWNRDLGQVSHQSFSTHSGFNESKLDTKSIHLDTRQLCSPTAPDIEGKSSLVEPSRMDVVDEVYAANIVIFGEAGVGKSSVINLIAGQKRAHISNDALGCTFQYQRHNIMLGGMQFAFWDTTGLDEGSEGTVPAKLAENKLRTLMDGLAHSGGIHLVIYCIRGSRLTRALKHNYDLFYAAVCRKKVSVALVVTGLEHQEEDMESWWDANEASLRRYGMRFHAHACVTTLDVDDAIIQARRADSQRRLRDLVVEYASQRPWKIEPSISLVLFRNILREVSMGKKTIRRVVIYDGTASCRRYTRSIGDRQLEYEFTRVDKPLTPCKSTGLLVFYTSSRVDTRIPQEDVAALRIFHDVAGGKTCPVIVVVRGCHDEQLAQRYWDAVVSRPRYRDIQVCPVVDEMEELDAKIEELCIEHIEISRLRRAYEAVVEFFTDFINWI